MSLFTRFGLGHLFCRISLEKQAGIPAVQLILSLCLIRITGESIHSMYISAQERLSVDKQSLWSIRLWVIFRLSNVENLELINKITIFAHENGTQRKLGKRI